MQNHAPYSGPSGHGLRFVYAGNLPGSVGDRENTYCPACNEMLIQRRGFNVIENRMVADACHQCGSHIPGKWETKPVRHGTGGKYPMPIRS